MQPGHRPHIDIFPAFTSQHSILAFIVPVLVNFIEFSLATGWKGAPTFASYGHGRACRNRKLVHLDKAAKCPKGCLRLAHLVKGNTSREETYRRRVR
ncbi:hypothetical protein BT93_J1457 [Corymbia citriodora subsp. variegata]|nr:hypothetical protein BT93_J1457 [Corymbia citriodora subsp. variegata]